MGKYFSCKLYTEWYCLPRREQLPFLSAPGLYGPVAPMQPQTIKIMDNNHTKLGHATCVAETAQTSRPAPKWAALVDDKVVFSPSQRVLARVLKGQSGAVETDVLVRDHGSEHDFVCDDDLVLDLAEGNCFFTVTRCGHTQGEGCDAPAKLVWFVDDRPETTLRANQTGRSLRDLFGLSVAARLFRDFESPHDEIVGPGAEMLFSDGPVFYTRRAETGLSITVNKQTFGVADGVKPEMTGREIANLVTDQPCEVKRFKGDQEIVIALDEIVKIHGCEEFTVLRCNVVGGFEKERTDREVSALKTNGAEVEVITSPVNAVIYRNMPTRAGYPHLPSTDVLVAIPTGYPGVMLDGAYLPEGSPLLGKVVGAPKQGNIQVGGRTWELVSYHPHNGGGGAPWNPSRHGIHSYYSEVLSWIQAAAV